MQLNLVFCDNDVFKLRLTVLVANKEYEIKAIRWVQLIALLVYYRLNAVEERWITLKDISHLLSFKKLKPESIGKYLNSSIIDFPDGVG
jgi:hypothetical protein